MPPSGETPTGYTGDGIAINSPLIDGLATPEAKRRITDWLEEQGLGRRTINYKLRDWLFSRQRYWGEPFPIIWREGKHEAIPESELPLVPPPLDDFKPTGTGEPPLARAKDWVRYSEKATRELNTMPQWAGSCWYYLRFCDPRNGERFVGKEAERLLDGSGASIQPNSQPPVRRRRSLRRRHRARRASSPLRPFLAQGPVRSRASLVGGTIPAARESRNHPRRRRPQNVEALGQRHRPARCHRRIRRRRVPLLRDVYGAARADEALEHDRRGGRLALPRPGLAPDDGGKPGGRMGPFRPPSPRRNRPARNKRSSTPRSRKSAKTSKRSRSTPRSRR